MEAQLKEKSKLLNEARARKAICSYILEKKQIKSVFETKEFKRIAPNIFVFQKLSESGGPFEYDEMIEDQLNNMVLSSMKMFGWSESLIKSLLSVIGVTQIVRFEKDFSRKPTGYYDITGVFSKNVSFQLYGRVGTE